MKLKKLFILTLMMTIFFGGGAWADTSGAKGDTKQNTEINIARNGIIELELANGQNWEKSKVFISDKDGKEVWEPVYSIDRNLVLRVIVPNFKLIPGEEYKLIIKSSNNKNKMTMAVKVKEEKELKDSLKVLEGFDREKIESIIEYYEMVETQNQYYANDQDKYYVKYDNNLLDKEEKDEYSSEKHYLTINNKTSNEILEGMLWREDKKTGENIFLNIHDVKYVTYADDQWCYFARGLKTLFGSTLYKVKTDGTKLVRIEENPVISLGVVEGDYYYVKHTDTYSEWKLIKMDLESGKKETFDEILRMELNLGEVFVKGRLKKFLSETVGEDIKESLLEQREYLKEVGSFTVNLGKRRGIFGPNVEKQEKWIHLNHNIEKQYYGINNGSSYDALSPCYNYISEDDKYVYYHDGEVLSYVKGATKTIYQKSPCNIYRKNKKSYESEVMAENVYFINPEYCYYSDVNKLQIDMESVH